MSTQPLPPDTWRIIRWVSLAILAWGMFHAVGAWRFNHDPARGVMVLVCVVGFLGFWLAMLAARQRRLARVAVPPSAALEPAVLRPAAASGSEPREVQRPAEGRNEFGQ